MALLELPNGNAVAPTMIRALRRLDRRRFVLLNEYGKLIDIDERDDKNDDEAHAVSMAFMRALQDVLKAGRRWVQPDWNDIREQVLTTPAVDHPLKKAA